MSAKLPSFELGRVPFAAAPSPFGEWSALQKLEPNRHILKVDTNSILWHFPIMPKKLNLSQIGTEPVTAKELEKQGVSRNDLQSLLKSEKILRVGRGVYQLPSAELSDENQFRAATKRIKGPSAVCLLSALAFYNLTDEIPKKVWLIVDANRKSYQKDIRLFRSHKPQWKVGIREAQGYRITTIERTIVDCIAYQPKLGSLGIEALKRALKDKQTTASKVMEMAEQLKVAKRILPYLQVLV